MAGGFHQTATEQLKNHSKNPNTVKSLAECMAYVVQTEKYCQQNRGKRGRKTKQAT